MDKLKQQIQDEITRLLKLMSGMMATSDLRELALTIESLVLSLTRLEDY